MLYNHFSYCPNNAAKINTIFNNINNDAILKNIAYIANVIFRYVFDKYYRQILQLQNNLL